MTLTNTCIHVYIHVHVCDFTQQFTKVQTIPRDKFAEWLYICIYIMYAEESIQLWCTIYTCSEI